MPQHTTRRGFLRQSAGVTAAVVLAGSPLPTQAASPVNTLNSAELEVAATLVSEVGGATDVFLLVLNHVESLARQGRVRDVEKAVAVMRVRIVGSDDARAAERLTDARRLLRD
jgi:hypothetical protein